MTGRRSYQRRVFCLAFLIAAMVLLLLCEQARAYQVLVVQSRREPALDEALAGFRTARLSERVIVLSDYGEADVVRIVREERPALVLAVGDSALAAARKIRHVPVVALMALGFPSMYGSHPNLGGIGMLASPERYLTLFRTMKRRRVGLLYHPAKSAWYLRQARQAAQRMDIELILREVSTPRSALTQLDTLKGAVDALWMLPDTSAVTRETVEAYFHFSQEQRVPVISFAAPYLKLGAAAILELDRTDIGRQAGEMALSILRGSDIAELPPGLPRRTTLKSNGSVLRHLDISPEILDKLERE
ncbi:ABC transporter substrate-binding protein [Geobacter sp. SVR]|uniref:ABC transporter substrate-binding protein n=1 Tax=Geobacter sp. SVR TaxID=2495594 RepID=UPI001AFC67C6|nr:ABC transporter substrate binding protein [Geobacter sp. SVR]BCS52002.1 ABC transporter substrate-binding protein [Geobacter sp. SVR]